VFQPGYVPIGDTGRKYAPSVGLEYIDHMVGNVSWNEMDRWAGFYNKVFGMDQLISFDDKDISTDYTALKSKVMTTDTGLVKYPLNEPAKGLMKSQIEEYLDFNNGPGVQHIALATNDIIKTVSEMRERGVEFLRVPDTYYDQLADRVGEIEEDIQILKQLGILVDRDDKGYLLQIFTKPLTDRPTLFIEIIQRRGGFSFGKGNFKALFVSIEEEQRKRGTL
jgi:4-hydroxyphenylpyruvate dioxygenase